MVDIGEVSVMLRGRAEQVCRELLPRGHRQGQEWVEASTAEGGLGDALKVNLRRGVFKHFGSGSAGGDLIDMVAYVRFGEDKKQAFAWARSWLGLDGLDPARLREQRLQARQVAKRQEAAALDRVNKVRGRAKAMWLNGAPIAGTLAQSYLAFRGVDFGVLQHCPGNLRFAPTLHYGAGVAFPALLAAIHDDDNGLISCHRTWLAPDGRGKAPVESAKKSFGAYAGGCIRLWKGRHNKVWPKIAAGTVLVVTEGIEDGLNLADQMPDHAVIAAVSVSNFQNIAVPWPVGKVLMALDNNPGNKAAAVAVRAGVDNFRRQGFRVQICNPPAQFGDFSDMKMAQLDRGRPGANETKSRGGSMARP